MKKREILKDIFSSLHILKRSGNVLNGENKARIFKLEQKAQDILHSSFEEIEDSKVEEPLSKIKSNAKETKEQFKSIKDIRDNALKVSAYIDDTIEYLDKIKEMI